MKPHEVVPEISGPYSWNRNFEDDVAKHMDNVHFVIPAGFQPYAKLRKRHFLYVVDELLRAGFPNIIIALQNLPGADNLKKELQTKHGEAIRIVDVILDRPHYWKARQVNLGAQGIPPDHWLFQLDADILPDIQFFVDAWARHDQNPDVDFVKPWKAFVRLSPEQTDTYIQTRKASGILRLQKMVDLPCAGGFLIRKSYYDRIGGLDEDFKDWGWEDVALRATVFGDDDCRKAQFNTLVPHFEHESDRPYNPNDIDHFVKKYPNDPLSKKHSIPRVKQFAASKACVSFAIMSLGRCGSNMLRSALTEHPQIVLPVGEPFGPAGVDVACGIEKSVPAEHLRFLIEDDIFGPLPDAPTRGMLVHYDHPYPNEYLRHISGERLLQVLMNMDFRFLHLYRQDFLEQACSFLAARNSNTFINGPYRLTRVESLDLVRSLTKVFFDRCWNFHTTMRDNPGYSYMVTSYEAMCENWEKESRRIQRFLSVTYEDIVPQTKKQSRHKKASDFITNLDEVKEAIRSVGIPEQFHNPEAGEFHIKIHHA